MKKQSTHKSFNILRYITPRNVGARKGRLLYKYRSTTVKRAALSLERDIWHEFLKAIPGSLEESALAEELSQISMAVESSFLQNGIEHYDLEKSAAIAKSFTDHSIRLYGTQDVNETLQTMTLDIQDFLQVSERDNAVGRVAADLIEEYRKLGVPIAEAAKQTYGDNRLTPGDKEFRKFAIDTFQPVYSVIEADKMYSARAVKRLFSLLIRMYGRGDRRWGSWSVAYKQDGSLAVDVLQRRILIGRNRAPAIGFDLAASVSHEFVHAIRSVRAYSLESNDLRLGLSGYLPFEEGLGCYIEYVLGNKVPEKISNRQIAASLALGQLGPAYDRNAIFELLDKRAKVMMVVHGTYSEELYAIKKVELKTLIIDRFFRGGSGVGPTQAVFTKDVVYSQGFAEVKRYVRSQLARGVDPGELFNYLFCAKFDPMNEQHVAVLRAKGINQPSA